MKILALALVLIAPITSSFADLIPPAHISSVTLESKNLEVIWNLMHVTPTLLKSEVEGPNRFKVETFRKVDHFEERYSKIAIVCVNTIEHGFGGHTWSKSLICKQVTAVRMELPKNDDDLMKI